MIYPDNLQKLKDLLMFKSIEKIYDNRLYLQDGTVVVLYESDQDCCASADGEWSFYNDDTFEGLITDVKFEDHIEKSSSGYDLQQTHYLTITIFHNMNPVAQAECHADDGNSGYYYSVLSVNVYSINDEKADSYQILDSY